MTPAPARVRRVALFAACAVATATCDSPTGPVQYPAVTLQELKFYTGASVLHDSGLLVINGVPRDTSRVLPPYSRLRLALTTSAGDSESFELSPIVADYTFAFHIVAIVMKEGHHVAELFSLLDSVPARIYLVLSEGRAGAAYVFQPERIAAALTQLQLATNVQSAEQSRFAPSPPRTWSLEGGLPLDFSPVAARDGVLQAQPGDTAVMRYVQPDSSMVELKVTIPVP